MTSFSESGVYTYWQNYRSHLFNHFLARMGSDDVICQIVIDCDLLIRQTYQQTYLHFSSPVSRATFLKNPTNAGRYYHILRRIWDH
jgi:hypothetical protein